MMLVMAASDGFIPSVQVGELDIKPKLLFLASSRQTRKISEREKRGRK